MTARGEPPPEAGEGAGLPLTLLVAPSSGRLRVLPARRFRRGREWVEPGQPIARVERRGGTDDILAPMHGAMGGMLGRDGEPVRAGQPVAWLEGAREPRS